MGGALRQAGVIAGAMLYALDHHVARLEEDHRRAAWFGARLAEYAELRVEPVETNLVFFRAGTAEAGLGLARALKAEGLGVHCFEDGRLRACTHLNVGDPGIEMAASLLARVLRRPES